jgi:hypothetical protein
MTSLLLGIKLAFLWNGLVDTMEQEFVDKAPEFIFANGKLAVNTPMPYLIYKTQDQIMIVDTSGKTDASILNSYKKGILIGKNMVISKENELETRSYDLSSLREISFTKSSAIKYIPWLKWLNIFMIGFLFIYEIIGNLIAAVILGGLGLIVSKVIDYQIVFNDLYKIGIYALTLPIVLELARELTEVNIPVFKLVFYGIGIVYIVMALKILKKSAAGNYESPV